jgi:hypothetical protein
MNNRIRELAEQANIRFSRMAILDGDPRGMARFVSYSEFEKFAELIVQECADVITETRWHLPPTQQQIAMGIKEHFGVE